MPSSSSKKIHVDCPVTLILAALSCAVFVVDTVFATSLSSNVLSCPGSLSSPAFNFAFPLDYVRLLVYPLAFRTPTSFLTCLIFLLLLGPVVENLWGSSVFALMLLASTLVGGAFTAAFSSSNLAGLSGVAFMVLILAAVDKKTLPASHIAVFLVFACFEFFSPRVGQEVGFWQGRIPFFIELASGVAGSLYGFFSTPKKKTVKPSSARKTASSRKKTVAPTKDVTGDSSDMEETLERDTLPIL